MNYANIEPINAYGNKQPVIIIDGIAYPIGYDTRYCTATAADIAEGKTAAVSSGIVKGTAKASGGGSGSFVKVTEFIAPHDAYTAVTSIDVSGFGMLNNEMEGTDEDFSKYNGVYAVTPDTANEQELTDRVFKHPTEEMYIFFGQETENGEGDCWFFASSTDDTSAYGALAYKNGKELPNGQATWYKIYSDSPVLTTILVATDVPAQPLVLSGASAKLENGEWVIGEAVGLSGYDEKITPLKHGIYAVSDNQLVGDAIAYHADMYMPTDGLLAYFPMDSSSDIEVDVVSGIRVKKFGKGIMPGAEGADGICWESAGKGGLFGCNTAFKVPTKTFTLSAYARAPQPTKNIALDAIIDFGTHSKSSGIGIRATRLSTRNYWVTSLRTGSDEDDGYGGSPTGLQLAYDQWHLITITYDGNASGKNLKYYINGTLAYEQSYEQNYYYLAADSIDTFVQMFSRKAEIYENDGFAGKIDEVMLWNRVLSAEEIATLVRREETNG